MKVPLHADHGTSPLSRALAWSSYGRVHAHWSCSERSSYMLDSLLPLRWANSFEDRTQSLPRPVTFPLRWWECYCCHTLPLVTSRTNYPAHNCSNSADRIPAFGWLFKCVDRFAGGMAKTVWIWYQVLWPKRSKTWRWIQSPDPALCSIVEHEISKLLSRRFWPGL
jgi:hypothetical protein